jgi:hypothetical protein
MSGIPTLDLHGLRHHEVANEVARFIEDYLGNDLFVDIIVGNSEQMLFEAAKTIRQYGLQYMTGLPRHPGRIRIVIYDDLH